MCYSDLKVSGIYTTNSPAFVTWTLENPDASPMVYNRFRITEERSGGVARSWLYEYSAPSGGQPLKWKLSFPGNLKEIETSIAYDALSNVRTLTTISRRPGGIDDSRVIEKRKSYKLFGERLIERQTGPVDNPESTMYYFPSVDGPMQPEPSSVFPVSSSGGWSKEEYDSNGRLTSVASGVQNAAYPGRSSLGVQYQIGRAHV